MTYPVAGKSAGDRLYGPHQSRYVTVTEDQLIHPTHDDGFADKGDPVLVNGHALIGVALVDGITTATPITIDTEGIFALTVHGTDDVGDSAVAIGDALFINRSTCQINKVADPVTNTPFGYALGTVGGGASALIGIDVHSSPSGDINPALAERDFTTWTIQAIYDTGVAWGADTLGIRNNGQVLFNDASADECYIISSAGALLATLAGDFAFIEALYIRGKSLQDRYILFRSWDGTGTNMVNIGVQEGLTKLWERFVDTDKAGFTLDDNPLWNLTAAISASGEWIVVAVKEDGGNCLFFIYQGS